MLNDTMRQPPLPKDRNRCPEGVVRSVLVLALCLFFASAHEASPDSLGVDLQIVLAVDVSGSMDRRELEIQRTGYVSAIRDPLFVAAVRSGATGRIAMAYVEWAGPDFQVVAMPWTVIDGALTARRFSDELAARPILGGTDTSISAVLSFSAALHAEASFTAARKVIDVSGDGPNTAGPFVAPVRDSVVAKGITINALPLLLNPAPTQSTEGTDLLQYFEDCVIGGSSAFALPVHGPEGLVEGIRRKLILEVASSGPRLQPTRISARPRADCTLGQKDFYE